MTAQITTKDQKNILTGFLQFLKKEPVLTVSAICALVSAFFVLPSPAYVDYIDFRTLALLFCLMSVVAGLQRNGLFSWLAQKMLSGKKQRRTLFLLLILLPFFSSMLVTNDVALITFVPFAVLILTLTGQQNYMIFVIVMQTVAANLGSMATPVGNPQNLYLYSRYGLSAGGFFAAVLPYALLALPLLIVSVFFCPKEEISVSLPEEKEDIKKDRVVLYLILFVLCLLSVFHVLHYGILLAIVCIALFAADRSLYRTMDYGLLLTFVCFFIFSGNLGAIDSIKTFLQNLLEKQPLLTSALASQVISNVPAAVLLSAFTADWKAMLLGTDLGGLGTPIASLASLISLRLYMKSEGASVGKFLGFFSVVNFAGLVLFLAIAMIF
ncbi:MAG: anion permease [Lachnospiraceae bacterium]|nr:anion permease [Lachnospiraceae bacterium]